MKRNDLLWKAALEDLFEDFLLFFYPGAGRVFNLKKEFEYLDKELEQLSHRLVISMRRDM